MARPLRSALYEGTVMHARGGDAANSFRYGHGFVLVDLAELPELERRLRPLGLPLFGWRRRALVRIDENEFIGDGTGPLRQRVLDWARRHGADDVADDARVLLASMPRQLGYGFNPISVFYVEPIGAGGPTWAVVEVHNTFGERHRYLAPVEPSASEHDKELHVSPFMPMSARYRMRLPAPDERFLVRIDLLGAGVPFVATWTGRRRPLTVVSLLGLLLRHPFGARLVMLRIHLQALRLWRRRAPLYRKPPFIEGEGTIVRDAPPSRSSRGAA